MFVCGGDRQFSAVVPPVNMYQPQKYSEINALQRRDFQETLAKFSSWLTWDDAQCDVLDVGCGSGDVTREVLRPSLSKCGRIVGIDVSPAMVDFATHTAQDELHLQFHVMDIATSQDPRQLFPDGFHKIYSNYCLNWVQKQRQAIQNMYDLLNSGGEMILLFLAKQKGGTSLQKVIAKQHWAAYFNGIPKVTLPYQNCEQPDVELREHLEAVGFAVRHCEKLDKAYTFPNLSKLRDFVSSINPYQRRIPSEKLEQFLTELLEAMEIVPKEDGSVSWHYQVLEAFATKP